MLLSRGRRLEFANWTTSIFHLSLLAIAAETESALAWALCLLLIAAISLLAWAGNMRRWRAITDTATSRIGSAAQGYVELAGRAQLPPGQQLQSQLRGTPCVWFWFRIERRNGKDWSTVEEGESETPFVIEDGSGRCLVHPAQAEVHSRSREAWREGDRRYTEITIRTADDVYAIGEFVTMRPPDPRRQLEDEIRRLIAQWKQDLPALRERFDLNRDGEIDVTEWALARAQARREAQRTQSAQAQAAVVHLLRKPADGRLYMVSNMDAAEIAGKYFRWKWVHLVIFFAALGAGTALLVW